MRVLRTIHDHYPNAWCRYGFVDAFNPLTDWYDTDVIGIDTGITMLMAENARTGFVWETFMKNPEAQRGMDECRLQALPAVAGAHAAVDAQPRPQARAAHRIFAALRKCARCRRSRSCKQRFRWPLHRN